MGDVPFCGRAILEARGHELEPPAGSLVLYTALRPSVVHDDAIWIIGRTPAGQHLDADALLADVASAAIDGFDFTLHSLGRGEGTLVVEGPVGAITDTDPFFEHLHPYAVPLGVYEAGHPGERTAAAVAAYLGRVRTHLLAHPVNTRRKAGDLPALHVLTTKWAGVMADQPSFEACVGVAGAMIPTIAFYRGLCRTLGMREGGAHAGPDHGDAMGANLTTALGLIAEGSAFVHVHTKATDLAGHTKDPTHRQEGW
jgi:2,3-bisphosphoglycerate-independent phosphoglycerate mutase